MSDTLPRRALPLVLPLAIAAVNVAPSFAQAAAATPVQWQHTDPRLTWSPCPPIFPKGCEVTVLSGDPTTGPSDVFLRVPSNYTFPPHRHTSAEHIVIVAGVVHVTYAGGHQAELKERMYGLVPGKAGHKAHCGGRAGCVLFIHFDSPIDAEAATDVP
ncbi:MAG: cupin domain-containing protein [Gemmatimonadales bacterium]